MSSIGFSKFIMKPLFDREYLLVHFIWEKGCNISLDWMKSTVSKELTSQRREILHFYRWAQLTNWSNKLLLQKYLALNRNGLNENPAKCYCPWEFWVQLFKPPRSVVKIVGEEGCFCLWKHKLSCVFEDSKLQQSIITHENTVSGKIHRSQSLLENTSPLKRLMQGH